MKSDMMKKSYVSLALIYLFAILLAVVPALMVWEWHMMALSNPTTVLCLIACWVCAVLIWAGCTWYFRQLRSVSSQSQVVGKTADSPAAL